MDEDDQRPKPKPIAHEVGAALDALSVEELAARIALLRDEIARLEAAIADRNQTRNAAEALFRL